MILQTTRFGELKLEDNQIVAFPSGLPGFREHTRFTFVEVEDSPFLYMQSVDSDELAFIVVSPFEFFHEYEFELSEAVIHELQIESEQDVMTWVIVNVRDEMLHATANLAAPVIVNVRNNMAAQFILQNSLYQTKHRLYPKENQTKQIAGG